MDRNLLGSQVGRLAAIRIRLAVRLHRISDGAFAEIDSFALVQDWQVDRGLIRHTYRERLFDALSSCPVCAGKAQASCGECAGTGRLSLFDPLGVPNPDIKN